ncbi:MAG: hypothetical protein H8E34_09600 [Bacteroidetes bacterium]|nr:hypothetical protein [Bacteroidota bacterium]MBL6942809.1 hypothetical protein [Bacteroidales bacterium]
MRCRIVIVLIISTLFFMEYSNAQSDTALTVDQINHYSGQSQKLISYLEGTLNFLGNPDEVPSDKDIIFNQSYLKIFASDKVQIEDDLDENREIPLNKDVQAYLKDIDFFFKKVKFSFVIEEIEQLVTGSGVIVFKLTLNRHLDGITLNNDTISNNQLRYVEINLDPYQKDLKIASVYTTKIREKEELRYWWNNMSTSWKNFFGKSVLVYDTLPFKNIIWFSDSSLVTMKWMDIVTIDTIFVNFDDTKFIDSIAFSADSIFVVHDTVTNLVPDTTKVNTSTIYRLLKAFRKIRKIDLSNNLTISDLDPVSELAELADLNISNTLIDDLSPVRNLNKLEVFNCSGTPVISLESLRYINALKELSCSNTAIESVSVLSNLNEIRKLDLSNTKVSQVDALTKLSNLSHLKISGTDVMDLSPLNNLNSLSDLNLSNTQLQNLSSIASLMSVQNLNIDSTDISNLEPLSNYNKLSILQANNTSIADLRPLNNHQLLKVIYCDNSEVLKEEANKFMDANPQCLVIYNSQELIHWWDDLPAEWQDVFITNYHIEAPVTKEKLHQLINQNRLSVAYNGNISSLEPLRMLHRLEEIEMQHTSVFDLTPLAGLNKLEKINLNQTKVTTLVPLSSLQNVKNISFKNTDIAELTPLSGSQNIKKIYCDESKVTQDKVIKFKNLYNDCLIIYQSQKLRLWWNNLDANWQLVLRKQLDLPVSPTDEELQQLVDLKSIVITNNMSINNLTPLHIFVHLEQLTITNTSITDISPITSLAGIKKLNISKNPIYELGSIYNLIGLEELIIENTSVEDLEPISSLEYLVLLNIAGTKVKSIKYLQNLTKLEKLYINNTRVKSLKQLLVLPNLKLLQCYNTSIKSSKIAEFRKVHPQAEVVYY